MQWAMVIMSIERSVPPGTAKEFLEAYSIKLTATERGVMVIKKKDKTRASQRKGALSNWKVRKNSLFLSSKICSIISKQQCDFTYIIWSKHPS